MVPMAASYAAAHDANDDVTSTYLSSVDSVCPTPQPFCHVTSGLWSPAELSPRTTGLVDERVDSARLSRPGRPGPAACGYQRFGAARAIDAVGQTWPDTACRPRGGTIVGSHPAGALDGRPAAYPCRPIRKRERLSLGDGVMIGSSARERVLRCRTQRSYSSVSGALPRSTARVEKYPARRSRRKKRCEAPRP
jgi:hypothetical protein